MKKYIYIILLIILLSLSSCGFEPKSKESFFDEIEEHTTKLQESTISIYWTIRQDAGQFNYSYSVNHSNDEKIIMISNEPKDKTKYYNYKYVFLNDKITRTHLYYFKDELMEEKAEADMTLEDFYKLRILEFHDLHFNFDDVDKYTSWTEFGLPIRYYSDIVFKDSFHYKNNNGYCDVDLSNVKLSYVSLSFYNYDIVGINSAGEEVNIEILISY